MTELKWIKKRYIDKSKTKSGNMQELSNDKTWEISQGLYV